MKSRTSSSKAVILKKDLTRFAPVWVEYSVILAIIAWILHEEGSYYFESDGTVMFFSIINLFYGFVCAMSVFGYLHDSVECNMVHAFPIRRETWFGIHVTAGFLMGLVPNTVFCLVLLPLALDEVIYLFLGIMLQFIFCYGLSIFCMVLTGRKFAALTLYGLFNFLAPLVQWAVTTLYLPRLPGIWIDEEIFYWFYPMYQFMVSHGPMEECILIFFAYALMGLVLSAIALLLYRKRKLEYAGDFLAVKPLTSVFLAAVSFASGCILAAISQELFGEQPTPMLVTGLLIGYFTGLMLLHKTVKVFQPKRIVGAVSIVAVVLGSLWVVELDLPNRVRFIPKPEDVKKVSIGLHYSKWADSYETNDPEVIQDILGLHQEILEQGEVKEGDYGYNSCFLTYEMDSGTELMRWYTVTDIDAYEHLQYYYSQPEYLLNVSTFEEFQEKLVKGEVYIHGSSSEVYRELEGEELEKMMELFWNDCVSGNMSPAHSTSAYPQVDVTWHLNEQDYFKHYSIPHTSKTYEYCTELWDKYRK